jgi:hypothetical protein
VVLRRHLRPARQALYMTLVIDGKMELDSQAEDAAAGALGDIAVLQVNLCSLRTLLKLTKGRGLTLARRVDVVGASVRRVDVPEVLYVRKEAVSGVGKSGVRNVCEKVVRRIWRGARDAA